MIDPYLVSILFKYIKPYMSSNPMIPGTRPVAMEPLPRPARVDNGVDDVVIMGLITLIIALCCITNNLVDK